MNCFFCKQNIKEIDFKKTDQLKRFLTGLGKIRSREKTGLCGFHQRKMAKAVKQARHLGLLAATKK
ncbi:MAG: 30S ribosomal protein S18 [Parcubacteria group bacterium CG08_land_8_20_14_0_20_43_9]|nr:MAG: 30S ribosomal protein S18 [Parcubacteria group bacterium CG08_land_8_20_14_0_20_43_9]